MALPTAVQAQFKYTINANLTITITGYTGLGGSVSIPDMTNGLPVTGIKDSAFAGSSATNIMIPHSVTNFSAAAFGGCDSLLAINVDLNNGSYSSAGGVLFDKVQRTLILYPHAGAGDYTIPTGVTTVATGAFSNCTALTSVTIPSTITTIGYYACQGCTNLHSITIPDSVINIGVDAFYNCSGLTNAAIGNSVANIGDAAFAYCTKLNTVTIPAGVIGNHAFDNCSSLTNVAMGNSVTNIGDAAFTTCTMLNTVTIPDSVTNIGNQAFLACVNLTNATIGKRVVNIGYAAFYGCMLNTVTIPDSVINIGNQAFGSCSSLTTVTLGKNVVNIVDDAFIYCTKLNTVTIPAGVIGNQAFWGCSSLTTVTLGENVTSIGTWAFGLCPSLTGVYFLGRPPGGGDNPFYGSDLSIIYYVPGTVGWGTTFAGRPAIPINIQIQTADANFGVKSNQFGFNITGSYGLIVVVEATTSLRNAIWYPLQTNTITGGSFYFSDAHWTDYPSRFYRIHSP
jgi:hypothetical protein